MYRRYTSLKTQTKYTGHGHIATVGGCRPRHVLVSLLIADHNYNPRMTNRVFVSGQLEMRWHHLRQSRRLTDKNSTKSGAARSGAWYAQRRHPTSVWFSQFISAQRLWIGLCSVLRPLQHSIRRRFLQVKRPNQQHQSTEASYKEKQKQHKEHSTHRNAK